MLIALLLFTANVLLLRGLSLLVPAADGWTAILFRGVIGLGLLVGVYGGSRGLTLKSSFTHPKLAARGLVGAFATLLFYITIIHLGASRAIVINLSYPLFGVVAAAVWLKEGITPRAGFWLLAGFGGLLLFFSDAAFTSGLSLYDLLAIIGAVTSGIAVVLIRGLSHHHHPSTIYASQCVYGVLLTIPVAGLAIFALPVHAWLILALGSVLVAVAQLSLTAGFRHLSVAKGSSIQMLLPILTSAGAFVFFEETFTSVELIGGLLALGATWQVLRSPAPHSPLTPPPPPLAPAAAVASARSES